MQSLTPRRTLALLSALLLTASLPHGLSAQDDDGDRQVRVFSFNRARIGVMVQMRANKDNDKLGATISNVTEDGPADKAGLKEGDIITKFNGTSLASASSSDDEMSGPGEKLVKLAGKLDKGDTVQVEYRRGTDNRKTQVVADELSNGMARSFSFMGPDGNGSGSWNGTVSPRVFTGPETQFFRSPDARGFTMSMNGFRRGGLELTDLSPELGEYFGAKSGVLVLKTPEDSTLGLKAGDVITAIDGRTPTTESQVHRILSSYDAGETAKIEVLRKQKKVTVSWKIPEESAMGWKRLEEMPKIQLDQMPKGRVKLRTRT